MEKENQIDVLNTLITINNDRIEGYERAAKETDEQELKTMFAKFTATSQRNNQELSAEVYKLNGKPSEGTNASGKIYRVWMDVKAALTGMDRKAILNSCEYGEEVAVDTYDDVLQNSSSDISAEHQALINEQRALIKADHEKVKSMVNTLERQH